MFDLVLSTFSIAAFVLNAWRALRTRTCYPGTHHYVGQAPCQAFQSAVQATSESILRVCSGERSCSAENWAKARINEGNKHKQTNRKAWANKRLWKLHQTTTSLSRMVVRLPSWRDAPLALKESTRWKRKLPHVHQWHPTTRFMFRKCQQWPNRVILPKLHSVEQKEQKYETV